ncbi:MAG: hypothetical protein IT438_10950 [Phycisphaerales bacterium]|nr:hypothetical protein [Phycisphaerales bacterium]
MSRLRQCSLIAGILASLSAPHSARADEVFSNLGFQPGSITTLARSPFHVAGFFEGAVAFTVPSGNGFTLTAIDLLAASPDTTTAQIHIYANESGAPGAELASLTLNGLAGAEALVTATPAGGNIVLQPNAIYWVSMTVDYTVIVEGPAALLVPHEAMWRHVTTTGVVSSRTTPTGSWNITGLLQSPSLRVRGTPIPPVGACCNPRGGCYMLASDVCQAFGGRFLGGTTACATSSCPNTLPTGACCRGLACAIEPILTCTGRFEGEDTVCTPIVGVNRCCRADFNASGALSVQDLFDFLTAYFAGCP